MMLMVTTPYENDSDKVQAAASSFIDHSAGINFSRQILSNNIFGLDIGKSMYMQRERNANDLGHSDCTWGGHDT